MAGCLLLIPFRAGALPTGGQVVAGQATITTAPNLTDITQNGAAAVINWRDFSIGADESVHIRQAGPDAALLNRVVGADPSALLGKLQANGRVFLVNPNGVLVGKDARIDTGAFLATTARVNNANFMAGGDLSFARGTAAGIVNLGVIKATHGDAVLVACRVVNRGEISAPQGTAALGAATSFVYAPAGGSGITVTSSRGLGGGGVGVDNAGLLNAADAELTAADGNLYALAVNQTGIVRATGVKRTDGRILLTAAGGSIKVDGTLSAHRADGSGGEVLVGGGEHGTDPAVPDAASTKVGSGAVIDVAAATAQGDGGRAVVWSNGQTDFAGRIDGRGGAGGGNGGAAEVSGKQTLNFSGSVDLTAPAGRTGDLLLDPSLAVISTATDDQTNGVFNNTVLGTALNSANVTIDASTYGDGSTQYGDIDVNAPVTWTSANTLTLKAGDNINVNADLTGGTGSGVVLNPGYGGDQILTNTTGDLTVGAAVTITAATVAIGPNLDAAPPNAGNLPPASSRFMGKVTINGVLNTSTLDLQLAGLGINGDVSIANPANKVGALATSVTGGSILGTLTVANGSGDLSITGSLKNTTGNVTITTPGNLTLASGAAVSTEGLGSAADIALASTGGSFINQAGSSAVALNGLGRFLVYSDNPTNTTLDGLSLTPVYNKTYASDPPSSIAATGNRVLYSLAPTLTITADNQSRTYGGANPTLTYTVTGLVGGDTAAEAFSGTPALSTGATASSGAGSYAIAAATGTVAASDYNYKIQFAPGTLTVNKAPLTITADNLSKTQGDPNPTLTATYSGLVNGDTAAAISGLTLSTTATTGSAAGTYPITVGGASSPNYAISLVNGILTVNSVPTLTITANDFAKLYGAPLPTFTAGITGFKSGDNASIVSGLAFSTTATAGSPVGTYTIVPSGATASGYDITYVDGTLTINPAALTITTNDASRLYGAANPTFGVTYSGFVNGDTSSAVSGLTISTTATASSNVGTYAITPSGATAGNYTITETPGTLTVNQAPLTIDVADATKTYADLNPTFSAGTTGLQLGQSLSQLGSLSLSTTAAQLSSVGTYPITGSLTSPTSLASNYDVTVTAGTLSVTPRPITATASSASRGYGDSNPSFTVSFSGTNPPGHTNLSLLDSTGLTVGTAATASSDVGTYAVTASGITDPNFDVTYVPGTLTINPAALTITANDANRLYGAANPTFGVTYAGFVNGDTSSAVSGLTVSTSATSASNAGTYAITPSGATAGNYTITEKPGTLTVNQAPLTITANDVSRLYGAVNPTFSAGTTGLQLGQSLNQLGSLSLNTTASQLSDVGTYPISASLTNLTSLASNYDITMTAGTLSISPAALTITADDASRLYGATNPTFGVTYAGFVNGDTSSAVSGLTVSTSATSSSNAGTYAITPSGATAGNYTITETSGTLTVNQAPLTITANDASRLYGAANPTFGVTYAGFVNGDTSRAVSGLTVSTSATSASIVGTYAITPSGASAGNYAITETPGTLTVNKAPLTIAPQPVSRIYGDANPVPAITATGLKNGDTASVVTGLAFNFTATKSSNVGSYTTSILTASAANYDITTLGTGTLTVLPRPLTITANDFTRVYGDPNPTFTATYTGLASFDDASVVTGLKFSTAATVDSGVQDAAIVPSGATAANYAITYVSGSLTIKPAPLSFGTNKFIRVYGQANIQPPPVTGLKLNDTYTDLGVTLYGAPAVDAGAGTYTVQVGIADRNYTVTSPVFGTLTVQPLTPTVVAGTVISVSNPDSATQPTPVSDKQAFLHPQGGLMGPPVRLAFGLPEAALPVLVTTLENFLNLTGVSGSEIAQNLKGILAIRKAMGLKSNEVATDKQIYAFLANIHTDAAKQALLAPLFTDYVMDLTSKPPSTFTKADTALVAALLPHLQQSRDQLVTKMQQEYHQYMTSDSSTPNETHLTTLFGGSNHVPWGKFMSDAAGAVVEENAGNQLAGTLGVAATGAVAGGAAAATIIGAASTIFPFAVTGTTAIGATGVGVTVGASGSAAAAGAAAAGGPAAVVVAAVVGSVVRGIQVFNDSDQQTVFNALVASKGGAIAFAGMDLKDDPNSPVPMAAINRAILFSALTDMMSGS